METGCIFSLAGTWRSYIFILLGTVFLFVPDEGRVARLPARWSCVSFMSLLLLFKRTLSILKKPLIFIGWKLSQFR